MKYKDFVNQISEITQFTPESIKEMLEAMPKVLIRLKEREGVRTPLGILKMVRRKQKRVLIPKTKQWAYVDEQLRIKLQPHKNLCVNSAPLTESQKATRKRGVKSGS